MRRFVLWSFALLCLVFSFSCSDDDLFELQNDGFVSEAEAEILKDCLTSTPFVDTTELRNNLLGYWQLVGYACGFCPADSEAPEASITFSQNTGVLRYELEEESVTLDFNWSLSFIDGTFGRPFFLETEPTHPALNIKVFCEEFIYFNDTAFDGPMFLYQKN